MLAIRLWATVATPGEWEVRFDEEDAVDKTAV